MAKVYPIGEPINKSEQSAIAYFVRKLPHTYHLFHNMELPTNATGLASYEYDQVIIGEHMVYVIEVKGYQGVIRGNAREWDLGHGYFVPSPLPTTHEKARVLKSLLTRSGAQMEAVWVQPLVVLTDSRVTVNLSTEDQNLVRTLPDAANFLLRSSRCAPITPLVERICAILKNRFRARSRENRIGDYQVIETMGKNALYSTLLAENPLLRTRSRCVLKVYSLNAYDGDKAAQRHEERIMRDADAMHRLPAHPHIVPVLHPFRWINQDGKPKIVLVREWSEGFSLRGLLDSESLFTSLSFAQRIAIVRQVGEGLHHAHSHGVIHRDVRPENIIVSEDANIPVKLVNFDCARIEDGDLPTIATRIGKELDQRYVAPEVWEDASAASRASDIYAVGVLLFVLLTGRHPYNKVRECFASRGLPQLPSQLDHALPKEIDDVVTTMCAMHPADRYATMEEALVDMEILSMF